MNALGGVSGLCGMVNDSKQLKEIELNLKFAASFETIKCAERNLKRAKAKEKRETNYNAARERLGLGREETIYKRRATKLTVSHMKVFYMC